MRFIFKNKYLLIFSGLLGCLFYLSTNQNKEKNNLSPDQKELLNNQSKLEINFKSKIGAETKEKLFSIPDGEKIFSYCPPCKEEGVDPIEGQGWFYEISSDYQRYAYTLNGQVVVDGERKKQYSRVHHLKFSPNNKDFVYHAFDEDRNMTFLVFNDIEIPVYSGSEGYPHATNGITETFSDDGKHFAYSRNLEEDGFVEIVLDNKLINKAEGYDIHLMEFKEDTVSYFVTLKSRVGKLYDYDYYIGDQFIKTYNFEEFDEFQMKNNQEYSQTEIGTKNKAKLDRENKLFTVNDIEITSYEKNNPEVYFWSLIKNNSEDDFAYIVSTNDWKRNTWMSLNGVDSKNIYNDIKNLHFSEKDDRLIYLGRIGRAVYKVTVDLID